MLPIVVSPSVASVISLESRAPDQERQLTNHVLASLLAHASGSVLGGLNLTGRPEDSFQVRRFQLHSTLVPGFLSPLYAQFAR